MKVKDILKVKIIPFNEKYTKDFTKLNFEWLEKYFYIEDYDHKVLTNPEKHILDKGGFIFFALVKDNVVGTVALINRGNGVFELSKMGVTSKYQGLKIGQKLIYHCINFAGNNDFKSLFLDSSRKLIPAITLYHKVGFRNTCTKRYTL